MSEDFDARKAEVARLGGNLMDLIGSHPLTPLAYVRMHLEDHRALLAGSAAVNEVEATRLWWIQSAVHMLEEIERVLVMNGVTT